MHLLQMLLRGVWRRENGILQAETRFIPSVVLHYKSSACSRCCLPEYCESALLKAGRGVGMEIGVGVEIGSTFWPQAARTRRIPMRSMTWCLTIQGNVDGLVEIVNPG